MKLVGPRWTRCALVAVWVGASGCGRDRPACARCGTVVVAATGEPSQLLPPLVGETVGRDIGDQVYERLADLAPGAAPIDSTAYRPALAERWERVDSLSWRFHLRPGARWQDGQPVTAEDVRFSFEAFGDSVLDAPARPYLAHRLSVVPRGLRDRTRPVHRAVARAAVRRHLSRPHHPEPHLVGGAAGELAVRHQHGAPRGQRSVPHRRVETRRVCPPGRQLGHDAARRPAGHLALRGRPRRRAESRAESRGRPARDRGRRRARRARGARLHLPARALRLGHLRLSRVPDPWRPPERASPDLRRRGDPPRPRAGGGPGDAGALGVRARGQGTAGPDVAAALDLERQHRHAAVRHGARRPRARGGRAGAGRTAPGRASGGAGRWRSTSWCRARARRAASSRWRCRRCGRPSARR